MRHWTHWRVCVLGRMLERAVDMTALRAVRGWGWQPRNLAWGWGRGWAATWHLGVRRFRTIRGRTPAKLTMRNLCAMIPVSAIDTTDTHMAHRTVTT